MRLNSLHPWDLSPREAALVQARLAGRVLEGRMPSRGTVLGVDVSYPRGRPATAAAVLMTFPGLDLLGSWSCRGDSPFPYVPGLLSFREIPVLLPLLADIPLPTLILADGQGIAHPRRFGLACHLGLLAGVPTVGCAKSRLCGEHRVVPERAGGAVRLTAGSGKGLGKGCGEEAPGRTVGWVLRSRRGSRPLYVSPGHLITPAGALRAVRLCLAGHRLPEPLRLADRLSKGGDLP